jgi:hypothetical protein
MLTDWTNRVRALLNRTAVEQELDDELRFHFEQHIEQYMKAGLDREEAMRRARLVFGGLDQIKEECRDARGIRVLDELWQDVSYGLRMLRRRRLSSAAAIATLTIGIGRVGDVDAISRLLVPNENLVLVSVSQWSRRSEPHKG